MLHEVVYSWYIRGDGTSITQQKSSIVDLADRLTVMANVADVLRERASTHVLREWQAKSVGLDLRAYYNEVPRTGEDYWQALASGVRAVTKDMDEQAWGLVSLHDRLLARMVEQGHRDDIRIALRRRSEVGDAWESRPHGRPAAGPPALSRRPADLPPDGCRPRPHRRRQPHARHRLRLRRSTATTSS